MGIEVCYLPLAIAVVIVGIALFKSRSGRRLDF
jgi:hypothetical protein